MFDPRHYYTHENQSVQAIYRETLVVIEKVVAETGPGAAVTERKAKFLPYFNQLGKLILSCASLEQKLDDSYLYAHDFAVLQQEFNALSAEVLPESYDRSFANPSYAVGLLGERPGRVLYPFYARFLKHKEHAFEHAVYRMVADDRLFLLVFECLGNAGFDDERALALIRSHENAPAAQNALADLRKQCDPAYSRYREIAEISDLTDLRYLFKYGLHIGETEIQTARMLLECPAELLFRLSRQIVNGYVRSFSTNNKDITLKSTALILPVIGYERLVRQIIWDLKLFGLEALVAAPTQDSLNKQYDYDHRAVNAAYLDSCHADVVEQARREAGEALHGHLKRWSGRVIQMTFGTPPFLPEQKEQAWIYTPEQQELLRVHRGRLRQIDDTYTPRAEVSYTGIAFPSPAVGEGYSQIWGEFAEINLLDSESYERMQQSIINVLDRGTSVHIKGAAGNQTDLHVQLHPLKDPETETNFLNGGATVNIPVGEVFTSPRLAGTSGVLHVAEAYMAGFKYADLRLEFRDGVVVASHCSNYPTEEENALYLQENLFAHHKNLPMGEFAIGTNTLAYSVAKRRRLFDVLPVLIAEKTGVHCAIGDPCFARSEDRPVFNPIDHKEVIARSNERTALRKDDPAAAYTNYHMDITLPCEAIAFVAAVTVDGQYLDIIRDGRFVIPGLDELNKPINSLAGN